MSIIDKILTPSMPGLEKALDLTWRRGQAIASNIANAETPRYRAVDYDFGTELQRAFNANSGQEIRKTDQRHMDINSDGGARTVPDLAGATKADGNNVDIDIMMTRLHKNQGQFTEAASIIRKQLRFISTAIRSAER